MQKATIILILLATMAFSNNQPTLKGNWNYAGGKFNNKLSPGPKDYTQQRKYTDKGFDAWVYTEGEKDLKYESGDYTLQGDSCLEIQTFCYQDQSMIGKTVHYHYAIRNDTLILNGALPNGALVEDYWVRVK
jgi:hypothetical protein